MEKNINGHIHLNGCFQMSAKFGHLAESEDGWTEKSERFYNIFFCCHLKH